MNKNNDFRQLCGIRGASVFPDEWYAGVLYPQAMLFRSFEARLMALFSILL
jgi:hypothetical protein